jgi:chromosome segregation ATPase
MTENEKTLNNFTTRMRQMILRFREIKKENNDLYTMVDQRDKEIQQLQAQLRQAQSDYQSLKMAKMIEITDGDMESAQKRLSKIIRDVNKCITLLSEK